MRYLSRIIKSSKVSLGKEMELDNVVVEKKETVVVNNNEIIKETLEADNTQQPVVKSQEEIEAMYMEEARKKSELFFDTEMQRAYSEGIEKANAEAQSIIESAMNEAERLKLEALDIKSNIANDYKKSMETVEKDIIELVLEVAQKVVAKEIEKPDYIVGVVSEAIAKSVSKKDTILKVSEGDYDFIIANKDKLLLNVEGFGEVDVQKETSLENGSCIVETKFGSIDGGIKTRMKQIEKEVEKILNR